MLFLSWRYRLTQIFVFHDEYSIWEKKNLYINLTGYRIKFYFIIFLFFMKCSYRHWELNMYFDWFQFRFTRYVLAEFRVEYMIFLSELGLWCVGWNWSFRPCLNCSSSIKVLEHSLRYLIRFDVICLNSIWV